MPEFGKSEATEYCSTIWSLLQPPRRGHQSGICTCVPHLRSSLPAGGKFSPKAPAFAPNPPPSPSQPTSFHPAFPGGYSPLPPPPGKPNQTENPPLTAVLTRKRATVAEATGAGRWGEGLKGDTVLLLRAAGLDGAQVAVAAGAEVARQRQVKCLRRCRLGFAAGGLAGRLVLVAQICFPYLSRQRQASGASSARPGRAES